MCASESVVMSRQLNESVQVHVSVTVTMTVTATVTVNWTMSGDVCLTASLV